MTAYNRCPACSQSFSSEQGMKSHHTQVHGESLITEEKERDCPECGDTFNAIANHWNWSDCPRPVITPSQHEILTGMMLGDGHARVNGENPHFAAYMTNRRFIEFLDEVFGPLSLGVKKTEREGGRDVWKFSTTTHPGLSRYVDWYQSGRKRYPDDLALTPTILKMWYCGDGHLAFPGRATRAVVNLSIHNESDRHEWLSTLFEDVGFEPRYTSGRLVFRSSKGSELLDWMGEEPPGFEYKWSNESEERYLARKEEAYEPQ